MKKASAYLICLVLVLLLSGCAAIFGGATPSDASATDLTATDAAPASPTNIATDNKKVTPSEPASVSDAIDELTLLPTSGGNTAQDAGNITNGDLQVEKDDDVGKKFTVSYKEDEETVQIGDIEKNSSGMLTIRLLSSAFTGEITDDPSDMFPILACVVIEGVRYDPMPQTGGDGFMDYCFDTKMEPDEILVGLYGAFEATDYDSFVSVNPKTKLPV